MTVAERIEIAQLLQKMKDKSVYSKEIGLNNKSQLKEVNNDKLFINITRDIH